MPPPPLNDSFEAQNDNEPAYPTKETLRRLQELGMGNNLAENEENDASFVPPEHPGPPPPGFMEFLEKEGLNLPKEIPSLFDTEVPMPFMPELLENDCPLGPMEMPPPAADLENNLNNFDLDLTVPPPNYFDPNLQTGENEQQFDNGNFEQTRCETVPYFEQNCNENVPYFDQSRQDNYFEANGNQQNNFNNTEAQNSHYSAPRFSSKRRGSPPVFNRRVLLPQGPPPVSAENKADNLDEKAKTEQEKQSPEQQSKPSDDQAGNGFFCSQEPIFGPGTNQFMPPYFGPPSLPAPIAGILFGPQPVTPPKKPPSPPEKPAIDPRSKKSPKKASQKKSQEPAFKLVTETSPAPKPVSQPPPIIFSVAKGPQIGPQTNRAPQPVPQPQVSAPQMVLPPTSSAQQRLPGTPTFPEQMPMQIPLPPMPDLMNMPGFDAMMALPPPPPMSLAPAPPPNPEYDQEIKRLKIRIESLRKKLEFSEKSIDKRTKMHEDAVYAREKLEDQLKVTRSEIMKGAATLSSYRKELDDQKEKCGLLQRTLKQEEIRCKTRVDKEQKVYAENERLKQELSMEKRKTHIDGEGVEARIEKYILDIQRFKQKIREKETKEEEFEDLRKRLVAKCKKTKESREHLKETAGKLQKMLAASRYQLQMLQNKKRNGESLVNMETQTLAAKCDCNAEKELYLSKENDKLRKQIQQLKANAQKETELSGSTETIRNSLEKSKRRNAELSAEADDLREEISKMDNDKQFLMTKFAEIKHDNLELESDLKRFKGKLTSSEQERAILIQRLKVEPSDDQSTNWKSLQKQWAHMEKLWEEEKARLNEHIQELKQRAEQERTQRQETEHHFNELNVKHSILVAKYNSYKIEHTKRKRKLSETTDSFISPKKAPPNDQNCDAAT